MVMAMFGTDESFALPDVPSSDDDDEVKADSKDETLESIARNSCTAGCNAVRNTTPVDTVSQGPLV